MAITVAELDEVRSYVGANPLDPTDADISARWDRLADVRLVAQEVLRARRAAMLADPIKFAIDGDYSEDRTENLKSVNAALSELADEMNTDVEATPALTLGELLRPDWNR